MTDLYELLEVSPGASPVVIAAAWKKLAAKAHPDAGGDAEKFKALEAAYATLSDPTQRAEYDRERREHGSSNAQAPPTEFVPADGFTPPSGWVPPSRPMPTTGSLVARLSRATTRGAVFMSLAPLSAVLVITAIGGAAVGWLASELVTLPPPASLFRLVVVLAVAWVSSGAGWVLSRRHSSDVWLWAVRGYCALLVVLVGLNVVGAIAPLIPVVLIAAIAFFVIRHRIRRGRTAKGVQS